MIPSIDSEFQAIDYAVADRVCAWYSITDKLFHQTIMAVSFALQQGHSCLSLAQCLNEAPYNQMEQQGFLAFPKVDAWLAHLAKLNLPDQEDAPIILQSDRIYFRRYWQFEQELAQFILSRQQTKITLANSQTKRIKGLMDEYFPTVKVAEIDWQKVSAANVIFSNFHTIIGGPGTGKTYTVTRILALLANLSEQPPLIKLAAPTGKAAQRLAESIREAKAAMNLDMFVSDAIPDEAQTIHRLLGVIPNSNHFRHNKQNPIEADVLLVDEVSMVDLPMMARLFRAIKPTTRLILLGDADQLPSVAAGSVLTDIVNKPHPGYSPERCHDLKSVGIQLPPAADRGLDRITQLTESRRFEGDSGIGTLALQVIDGDAQASLNTFDHYDDLAWHPASENQQKIKIWVNQYYRPLAHLPDLNSAIRHLKKFRILCATREGDCGVEQVNKLISQSLNTNRQPFYKGQPIMVTQNHYGLKLFNGDIGIIWPNDYGQLMAWFESSDQPRAITPGRLPAWETVYAMTIHKTQGSEFDNVAMLLPTYASSLLTRELIYTGLTRARKSVEVLGEKKIWLQGVTHKVQRWAGLADRINAS